MAGVVKAFTTREAQQLTGLTARRLQYWDETDFIRPSIAARKGRGSPRLYSFRDLVQLRVAAMLRSSLPLQALRRLKAFLDQEAPFATVTFAVRPDGEVVYLGPTGQPEAAREPGQIVMRFDVPFEEIRASLTSDIADARRRTEFGKVARRRGVLGNRPALSGTRIPPETVVRLVEAGWTQRRIVSEYPELTAADIEAALSHARRGRRSA